MPRTFTRMLAMGSLSLVLLVSMVSGATIRVPGDLPTIQAGIDAAVDGDTVLVAPGTYNGAGNKNLDYEGRMITVISENGPEYTIIDCENNGRGFNFRGGEGAGSRLEGFTICNGNVNDDGGGIYCRYDSSPTITNCTITGNTTDSAGGGVYCDGSSPTIMNCTISGNTADYGGGGIFCAYDSYPAISNCTLTGNTAGSHGGGIFDYTYSALTIKNCTISNNTA